MSLLRLAEFLDGLADSSAAVVTESNSAVIVFGINSDNAIKAIEYAKLNGFFCTITDEEGTEYSIDEVTESFGPYTVTINKPNRASLQLITNTGFRSYLNDERTETIWHVARLRTAIVTVGRIFLPWEKEEKFEPGPKMKNPRTLVKESSTSRTVAADIRPWILRSDMASLTCSSSLVWVKACTAVCLRCLPDEVDAAAEELRFKGPPKRSIGLYKAAHTDDVDFLAFEYLQLAVTWIFELENESEVRSLYFKAEVVRSGLPLRTDPIKFLKSVDSALEGAKLAYAMSVSELGKDTVKALADLKKTITEDTAKLTDATRQTIGAVAAALAVGIGLLAARIAAKAPINLIGSIMIIVAVYVALIIMTGWNLVRLQRQLRKDWHPKIYRFLTDAEYGSMVERPAKTAEKAFVVGASIGGGIVACLTIYICYLWFY